MPEFEWSRQALKRLDKSLEIRPGTYWSNLDDISAVSTKQATTRIASLPGRNG